MRKYGCKVIILWLLGFGFSGYGNAITSIDISGGSAIVTPGQSLTFDVQFTTASGVGVTGLIYDISLPSLGWNLTSRDYSTNFLQEDGVFDHSTPLPSAIGAGIATNNFHFESAVPLLTGSVTGSNILAETFTIDVAAGTPTGIYDVMISNVMAYDASGFALDLGGTTFNNLSLTVQAAAIPEPSTILLVMLGVLGIVGHRRFSKIK